MRLSPQDWKQLFVEASSQAAAHAKSIKQAYAGDIRWDVDIHSFVEAVFLEGRGEEYQLSASDMPVKHVLGQPKEMEASKRISTVTDALLSQLYGANGPKDTTRANVMCKASIEHHAEESGRQEPVLTYVRKVGIRTGEDIGEHDMKETNDCTYREEETSKPTWEWAMVPIKLERTQVTESNDLSEIPLRKEENGTFVALSNTPRATPDDEAHTEGVRVRESRSKKPQGRPQSPSARPSQRPSSALEMQRGNGSTTSKRKHEPKTHESQAGIEPSPKRARTSQADVVRDITEKELQFIKYLNNTMSRNIRSYAIGWLIEDDTLRLVYADRMGVVFTKPFEFLGKDATLFSLVIAAMGAASEHGLGVHPNVHRPRLSGDNTDEQYEVATLLLDGQGEAGSEVLEYDFDVDEKVHRSVYTEFGLVGRGMTVIPVKARPRVGAAPGVQASEELVAKVAWPHAARTGEDVFIRKVRSHLVTGGKTKMLQHIVELKASMTKDLEELNLPRRAMGLCPDEQDVRVCCILIMKCYRPLDAIGSPAEFHLVFVQVFRAHHWVYVTSKVLHGDISMNNIMWYRRGDEIVGVLCDWDLAEDQENGARPAVNIGQVDAAPSGPSGEDKGKSVSLRSLPGRPSNQQNVEPAAATSENNAKPRYRTGTGPFMAVELLLSNPPPAHKYRYDVESFFYVYVCGAATYRADRDRKIILIEDWIHESLQTMGDKKAVFFGDAKQYTKVFEGAHADFKPAIGGFLFDMWLAFHGVCALTEEIEMMATPQATTGMPRYLTPEDVKMIADMRQAQNDQVTYEAVMKIMGEPELLLEASDSPSA